MSPPLAGQSSRPSPTQELNTNEQQSHHETPRPSRCRRAPARRRGGRRLALAAAAGRRFHRRICRQAAHVRRHTQPLVRVLTLCRCSLSPPPNSHAYHHPNLSFAFRCPRLQDIPIQPQHRLVHARAVGARPLQLRRPVRAGLHRVRALLLGLASAFRKVCRVVYVEREATTTRAAPPLCGGRGEEFGM